MTHLARTLATAALWRLLQLAITVVLLIVAALLTFAYFGILEKSVPADIGAPGKEALTQSANESRAYRNPSKIEVSGHNLLWFCSEGMQKRQVR